MNVEIAPLSPREGLIKVKPPGQRRKGNVDLMRAPPSKEWDSWP